MEFGSQEQGTRAEGSPGSADAGELKEKATQLTHTARQRAMSTVDGQREQLGSLLDRIAQSAQGDRLGGFAADYARRGADYLRRHSAEEMFDHLRDGVRARPGLVLSACFVAGLAVARLMKREPERRAWEGDGRWEAERQPEYWDEEIS